MKVSLEQLKDKFIQAGFKAKTVEDHVELLAKKSLDDEGFLLPHWLKYPEIPMHSIGWRMGRGEGYMTLLQLWFQCLSEDEKAL